jgi:hypothetical protein
VQIRNLYRSYIMYSRKLNSAVRRGRMHFNSFVRHRAQSGDGHFSLRCAALRCAAE